MAGRPTDYSEEILKKANEYINKLPKDEVIHSIEGLADYIDISRSNIYLWASQDDKKEFSDIVEKVREKQGKRLINGGLKGELNASISKVILTKHGYREGIDQTTNDKDLPAPIMKLDVQRNQRHETNSEADEED